MGELINCKDCGATVSTDAKACPSCGSRKYKPKNHGQGITTPTLLKILGILFAILLIPTIFNSILPEKKKPPPESPKYTHGYISSTTLESIETDAILAFQKLGYHVLVKVTPNTFWVDIEDFPGYKHKQFTQQEVALITGTIMQDVADKLKANGLGDAYPIIFKIRGKEVLITTLGGLTNLTSKGEKIKRKYPMWSNSICNAIGEKRIMIGMTREQVMVAWGRPYKINTSTGAGYEHEQWVMRDGIDTSYVYFENGILTSIQQSR